MSEKRQTQLKLDSLSVEKEKRLTLFLLTLRLQGRRFGFSFGGEGQGNKIFLLPPPLIFSPRIRPTNLFLFLLNFTIFFPEKIYANKMVK